MFKNWSNRDWFWLMSIFLGFIIIILTWRLNDNDSVVNIISMFSSGASIILALVAIVQSTIYNAASNDLYTRMTEKLSSLENGVDTIKSNVIKDIKEVIDESPIDEDEKEVLKFKLSDIVSNEEDKVNRVMKGYLIERVVYNRLREIYEQDNSYDIHSEYYLKNGKKGIDILIEKKDKSQSILFEVRVVKGSNQWFTMLKNNAKKLQVIANEYKEQSNVKEIIPIILLVSEEIIPNIYKFDLGEIKVINITELELINSNKNQLKRILNIESQ